MIAAVQAIVGDRSRAEEIVQDAFEKGYRSWWRVSRLDRPGGVGAAGCHQRGHLGRATPGQRGPGGGSVSPPWWQPRRVGTRWRRWATTTCGRRCGPLPSEQASAVALRYGADLSLDEIAQTMNISVSAVKSLLHRGRASLRGSEQLQSQCPEGRSS